MREGRRAVGPDKYLGTGFRVMVPEMAGPAAFGARVGAAIEAGIDGIDYYNYGLIPRPRLAWIASAMDSASTRTPRRLTSR